MTKKIILGSASPRRQEILSFLPIPFTVTVSPFDEEAVPFHTDPAEYVTQIARGKADSLGASPQTILTADTHVFCENIPYGKPRNREEAVSHLQNLSGKWHTVYTGVCVKTDSGAFCAFCATRVKMLSLNGEQIASYLATCNTMDKAGAYAIQGSGALIIEGIEGCFYNVMGLPIQTTVTLLQKAGIDIWQQGSSH